MEGILEAFPTEIWVVLITFLGVAINAFILRSNVKKSRISESIISQRIEWSQTVRQLFVEFISLAREEHSTSNKKRMVKIVDELSLLFRVSERVPELLLKKKIEYIYNIESPEAFKTDGTVISDIINLQRIILKSEWKRIKVEVEKGKLLTSRKVNLITKKVARDYRLREEFIEFHKKNANEKGIASDLFNEIEKLFEIKIVYNFSVKTRKFIKKVYSNIFKKR
ncbi:hypothetical protein [Alkalicoccus urumqiensis]|uniref:Uncharacterized protein n=1 Tax=Alkalicoccus urumqiensis TaxID=1548213 RepID=A0A2P6ME48_ALKUR|nr:hypothetical protein [Alkalicoccus urumqiensis]PRO64559.1 hypothetical protein C6I21_13755 [Alkalicoccus urumqiensis]